MNKKRPKVGVCLCLIRDGKVLLHKRKGGHSDGVWAFPGGHLEYGETFEKGALRDLHGQDAHRCLAEEAGKFKVSKPEFWTVSNTVYKDHRKHYVVIVMRSEWISGEAEVMEPSKCYCWEWFAWDNLPSPLMLGIQDLVNRGLAPFASPEGTVE